MEQEYKLPLSAAVLINLNIMLSTGIFLNTVKLSQFAGALSPFIYMIVGTLMLPIIMSMAETIRLYPCGSFYIYSSKPLAPVVGFLSSWGYFTGKLASSAIMIHFASMLICSTIPLFFGINVLYFDAVVITTFAILNMLKMKASSTIQMTFMVLKSIPILFVILIGLLYFSTDNLTTNNMLFDGLPFALPFVVYAFVGFEASCSLSRHIKNSEVNGPKAIFYSFFMAVTLATLYQLNFFALVGTQLMQAASYVEAFPIFLRNIFTISDASLNKVKLIPQLAIAASALGGAYGIFFSNHWNLYELAVHNYTFFSNSLTKFNRFKIPFLCVVAESAIALSYIYLFSGSDIILQQISAFSSLIAYTLSIIALVKVQPNKTSILGLISCLILVTFSLISFYKNALSGILVFAAIIMCGLFMFIIQNIRAK